MRRGEALEAGFLAPAFVFDFDAGLRAAAARFAAASRTANAARVPGNGGQQEHQMPLCHGLEWGIEIRGVMKTSRKFVLECSVDAGGGDALLPPVGHCNPGSAPGRTGILRDIPGLRWSAFLEGLAGSVILSAASAPTSA